MFISLVRSKLHQARVTEADIEYEGSIGIDTDLLAQAGMFPYEKVLIADIENSERFETYIIPQPAGSRAIQLNGAAAKLVSVGDRVIIMAFAQVELPPPANWQPRVLILDENNTVKQTLGQIIGAQPKA
ncbi:MAG TPA: aspartate 1-decarboxylase [Phototrophicaceae bacterium]|nr:aspartate 1-decarboxylase [Phototrophicaceae bacterium]